MNAQETGSRVSVAYPMLPVIILGMVAALPPLATDLYLPAFHLLAESFAVEDGSIQVTLSVFFLGLALGQAFYGPLIDRFGRRGPLLFGIALYVFSTVLCLLTDDITDFTILRFVQALGACSGMIVGRAIVNDLFDEQESAQALSVLMMVMMAAPIAAPVLGGLILSVTTWQMIFVFMLAFGVVCGVLVWRYLPETLPAPKRKQEGLATTFADYGRLLRRRGFIVPVLVGGLAQGCMFAFITGSPFVFIRIYGVGEQAYGWLFGLIAAGLIIAAQANRAGLKRWNVHTLLGAALVLNVTAGVSLFVLSESDSLITFVIPLWFVIASIGFIGANSTAIAMARSGEDAGSGSALIGVVQFGCAFIVSGIVAAAQNGTAYPMTAAVVMCGLGALLLWRMECQGRNQAIRMS